MTIRYVMARSNRDRPSSVHVAGGMTVAGFVALAAAIACTDGVAPAGDIVIEAEGRIERSSVVSLRASLDGNPLAHSLVVWTVEPADAVELLRDGRARLLVAGSVTIRAAASGAAGSLTLDVAPPPTIVFDLLVDDNRDIYRAALDGQDLVRLTDHPGDDRDPTVAGGTVVFVSYRDGNGELYAVPLVGGTAQRLTTTEANEADPALSPDGARLAYTRSDGGVAKLWLAAADGGGGARITTQFGFAGSIEASPGWAPTSDRLVFVSTSAGSADLFTYDMASGRFALLVSDSASSAEVEPAWSHDGKWVAFASNRPGATELYLLEVATGALTRLTGREDTDAQPGWVSDNRLVYVAWVDGLAQLRWLDPQEPAAVFEIAVNLGEPRHPTGGTD